MTDIATMQQRYVTRMQTLAPASSDYQNRKLALACKIKTLFTEPKLGSPDGKISDRACREILRSLHKAPGLGPVLRQLNMPYVSAYSGLFVGRARARAKLEALAEFLRPLDQAVADAAQNADHYAECELKLERTEDEQFEFENSDMARFRDQEKRITRASTASARSPRANAGRRCTTEDAGHMFGAAATQNAAVRGRKGGGRRGIAALCLRPWH
jgi:hypothetical protein